MSLAKHRKDLQKGKPLHSNAFTAWTETWFIFLSAFHLCKFSYNGRVPLLSLQFLPRIRTRDLIHLCHWSFFSSEKTDRKLIVSIVLLWLHIIYFWGKFHTSYFALCVNDLSLTWLILPEIKFLSCCCFLSYP